jgi:hypothetical protein
MGAQVLISGTWYNMFKMLDIREGMEVVGSDNEHVGTVDHKEGHDRIILTKDDPKAGGRQHLISIDWVDYVDGTGSITWMVLGRLRG